MSNIDKQAVTAKTKELASLMVERFSMNPVSCKLLNEAWKKEFPDEVAIAERMLALLDENIQLQRGKDAIEAVALALRDDMRQAREQLAAAEQERENWRISFDNERYRADKLAAALNAEREKLVMANRSLITQHIRASSAESRIAELEARTVTLPDRKSEIFWPGDAYGFDSLGYVIAVKSAIHAAGIQIIEEGKTDGQ
ncbi:ead/Ea22-like family protein [Salmonella enterica subsp. enterica serovar Pomona]|nr:ead/Ea22-like family protein [Salmonella enterica subsp. enterica serovar Pomona]EDY0394267.1 ead/Ea22-like family protein [Salmonella enterica subsp. enterica serovar Pomona]